MKMMIRGLVARKIWKARLLHGWVFLPSMIIPELHEWRFALYSFFESVAVHCWYDGCCRAVFRKHG